jgi:hypothetical protein
MGHLLNCSSPAQIVFFCAMTTKMDRAAQIPRSSLREQNFLLVAVVNQRLDGCQAFVRPKIGMKDPR